MKKIGVFVVGAIIIFGFWLPGINVLPNFRHTEEEMVFKRKFYRFPVVSILVSGIWLLGAIPQAIAVNYNIFFTT